MLMIPNAEQEVKPMTQEEFEAALASLLARRGTEKEVPCVIDKPTPVDMQALQERFLLRMEASKSAGTLRAYKYDLQAFNLSAAVPTVDDVAAKVKEWREAGISPNTVKRRLFSLMKFLRAFPIQFGMVITEIQAFLADFHRVPAKPRQAASRADVESVLRRANPRTGLAISLMYFGGLRVGDVAALRIGDVKKKDGKLCLEIRTHKRGTYISIPFIPQLAAAYKRYMQVRGRDGRAKESDSLFLSRQGTLSVRQLQRDVHACFAEIGATEISCHSLRHGCATALAEAGAPVYIIAKVLGHSMRGVTSRYIHLTSKDVYAALVKAFPLVAPCTRCVD